MSRVQVLDNAPVAPGTCILCGSSGGDGRKFVDFGMQIDWIGAIYFCTECFGEVSRAIGYIPVAEFDAINKEIKSVQAAADIHAYQNKRLMDALGIIFSELGRKPESIDDYIDRVMASVAEPSESEGASKISADGESTTGESSDVEGSDDLFDDSDFE